MDQQPQSVVYPQSYSSPYAGGHAQSMVQMTEVDSELFQLQLSLECCEYNNEIKKKMPYAKPLMNRRGVYSCIGQVKAIVHRITIMSNLDEKEIGKMMLSFSDAMIVDLMLHRRDFGIVQSNDRTKILRMCQAVVYVCIKRAIYGDDKKTWSKIQSDNTTTLIQPTQQAQPWYRKIFR